MSRLTKKMILAAQSVAFEDAAAKFLNNPTTDAFRELDTQMWAWQKLKHFPEQELVDMCGVLNAGDWSEHLAILARKQ